MWVNYIEPLSKKLNLQKVRSEKEYIALLKEIDYYKKNGQRGFLDFVFKRCKTQDFDDFAVAQGRKPTSPKFRPLPNKQYIIDLLCLIFNAPYEKVLVILKSRQMSISWLVQCYVVYCMLFRENQRIAWTNLRFKQAQAAIKRMVQILENLDIPYPYVRATKTEIEIPDLNNLCICFGRGDTQLTSEAWTLWVPDEFSKIVPVTLQDEIWKEAAQCIHGQIIMPSTAIPECLFHTMSTEPGVEMPLAA